MQSINITCAPLEGNVPVDIDKWELTLVRYFLAIGPEGDASDIHSIEVSPRTLALACGVDSSREDEVEDAFRTALLRDQTHLLRALREGPQRQSSSDVPKCFAPLAMTLLIDILLEGPEYAGNQFRVKLADWLRIDRTFSDLSGVKLMWEEVARWLDRRVAQGDPFRRLVLPIYPATWRHIGYTRRLSFPNRADIKAIVQALAAMPKCDLDNPAAVIHASAQLISKKGVSIGLKEAYEDFVQSYYSQRRAIVDHRFWHLVAQARTASPADMGRQVVFEIAHTADDEKEFRLTQGHTEEARVYFALSAALRDEILITSANLGSAIGRGLLFFRQVGLGRWSAEQDLAKCRARVLVAFEDRFARAIGRRLGKVNKDGQWSITIDPIDVTKVAAELRACGAMVDAATRLFRPTASDGVRVHGAWLGLPGYLPSIEADTNDVRVVSEGSDAVGLRAMTADGIRLAAQTPVSGIYLIEPRLLGRESRPPWRLRLQFVNRAAPHLKLGGARRHQPSLKDWSATRTALITCDAPNAAYWGRAHDAMEWLLEAVYASGPSGWDEADLVDLVRRASPEVSAVPWRTLRMLQEGGVIEPRLRQRWKGRVWILTPPRIVAAFSAGKTVALAEGALCAQLLDEFAMAATGMGGVPFRLPGPMRWSVPITGVIGADPEAMARLLGWEFVEQPEMPANLPLMLTETERRAENYFVAFTWCWRARRFVAGGAAEGTVRLTQLSHPAGTDQDVYRLECGTSRRHFLSRQAAIIAAHAAARIPLMAFVGDQMVVTARDGGLPDAVATALRRWRLASGGFADGCYAYSVTIEDVRWLATLLPGCLAGVPEDAVPGAGEILARARHSGGWLRPQWRSGQLVL